MTKRKPTVTATKKMTMKTKYRPGSYPAYEREVLCDQFREPTRYGFSPLRCVVWSGILIVGLTVGGMLVRWVLGVLP